MTNSQDILKVLKDRGVEFDVIGGVAAVVHGSAHLTNDIDLCNNFTPYTFRRLISSLDTLNTLPLAFQKENL